MAQHIILGAASTSSSFFDNTKDKPRFESQSQWNDIKNFLYIADALASTIFNFNIFSEVPIRVPVYLFVIMTVLYGMPYMCMDVFIKSYKGKTDLQESLNPLLKAVNFGMLIQTLCWSFLHANYLADSICYFFIAIKPVPTWADCARHILEECVPTKTIKFTCETLIASNKTMDEHLTSSHYHYMKMFKNDDRSMITRKIFVLAVVWISNFLICTISDQMMVKVFSMSFLFRNISTILAFMYVLWITGGELFGALKSILNFDRHGSFTITTAVVLYQFGIGLVGVYDFGTISPFIIIDNAVVMFAISFTMFAFLRSTLIAMMRNLMDVCIKIHPLKGSIFITHHYFLFAIMPLSADFLFGQRIFSMYLFISVTMTLCVHIGAVTIAVAKILHSEFRQIRTEYLSGSICFLGFLFSIPFGWDIDLHIGYFKGLSNGMLILGALKSAIVMYVYGVQRFVTDIHFWLGFKPTKYWIICWRVLPIILTLITARWCFKIKKELKTDYASVIGMYLMIFVFILVLIIEIRTIFKYIAINNLTGLFRSSIKYGPSDPDERKKRKNFNEDLSLQTCTHSCVIMDDKFDCNHMPIIFKTQIDDNMPQEDGEENNEGSMMQVFKASSSRKGRVSDVIDAQANND